MLDSDDAMRIVKADLANLTMQAKGDRKEVSNLMDVAIGLAGSAYI